MRLKLPQLRLPRVRFAHFPAISGRLVLYSVYTFVLFLVFLVTNFPHHVLVRRALENVNLGPVHFGVQATRFAWWNGYELQRVMLTQADVGLDSPPLLETSKLYVRPSLAGLLRGKVASVNFRGPLYGGNVHGSWVEQGGKARATVRLEALQVGLHPMVVGLFDEGQLAARLSGLVSFEPRGSGIAGGEAVGELTIEAGRLVGASVNGFVLPDLHSCTGGAKIQLSGERLKIEELQLNCDELTVSASGELISRPRLSDSRLNFRLEPGLGSAPSEEWKNLLPLIPCWISGTADRPRTQLCNVASQVQRLRR